MSLGAFASNAGDTCRSTSSDSSRTSLGVCPVEAVLENRALRCAVDIDTSSPTFGAVISFTDKDTAFASAVKNQWFRIRAGRDSAVVRKVVKSGPDTIIVEIGPIGKLPLDANLLYHLQGSALVLSSRFVARGQCALDSGLSFEIAAPYAKLESSNQRSRSRVFSNIASGARHEVHHDNFLRFSGDSSSVTFLIRNPFHSYLRTNVTSGRHRIDIAPVVRNIGSGTQGLPAIHTTLEAGDTMYRRIEVHGSRGVQNAFCLSQHPNGFSQCITMYWDELPAHNAWTYMTTDTALQVIDNYFVKLLNQHPRLKMGYLLLTDRILFRDKSSFSGWDPSSPYIIPDTLDEAEGTWCASFISPGEKKTMRLMQSAIVEPRTRYQLHYMVKAQGLGGLGAFGVVYGSSGALTTAGRRIAGTTDWTEVSLAFQTTSADTSCKIYLKMEESKGLAFFDDVRLTKDKDTTNLLENGDFEQNVPTIIYDNSRRHWSDAHGREHISSMAPPEYSAFLRRIENDSLKYGWENRVRLGCHGYHHTPSLTAPEPSHEFYRHDPYGDSLVMHRIFSETAALGLTKASLRYLRPPGFHFTKSLVDLLIDSGFVFFDASPQFGSYQAKFLQRNGRRVWAVWTTWWGDVIADPDHENVPKVLRQGHLAHIGAHPQSMWEGGINRYWEMNHLVTMWEKEFPNMGYVFPDEWADNANAAYSLAVSSVDVRDRMLICKVRGAIRKGTTAIFHGACRRVLLDGSAVAHSTRDSLTYIVFPEAKGKLHTIVVEDINQKNPTGTPQTQAYDQLTRSVHIDNSSIRFSTPAPAFVSVRIYTISGKLVAAIDKSLASGTHALRYKEMAPGSYLVRARMGSTCASSLVSRLR